MAFVGVSVCSVLYIPEHLNSVLSLQLSYTSFPRGPNGRRSLVQLKFMPEAANGILNQIHVRVRKRRSPDRRIAVIQTVKVAENYGRHRTQSVCICRSRNQRRNNRKSRQLHSASYSQSDGEAGNIPLSGTVQA